MPSPPLYDATEETADTGNQTPIAKVLQRLDEVEGKILREIILAMAPAREVVAAVKLLEARIVRLEDRLDRIDGRA